MKGIMNQGASRDARYTLSGRDAMLYDALGNELASMESFSSQINVTTQNYQPLGTPMERKVIISYGVSLTMSQIVIEDDQFIREFLEAIESGIMPNWNFQGVIEGNNGSQQRIIYRQCIPDGAIDLQNVSVGDIIKRNWTFAVNEPPELQSLLAAGGVEL